MLIKAKLNTYKKKCAKRDNNYQKIFAQQIHKTIKRHAANLKPPA